MTVNQWAPNYSIRLDSGQLERLIEDMKWIHERMLSRDAMNPQAELSIVHDPRLGTYFTAAYLENARRGFSQPSDRQ